MPLTILYVSEHVCLKPRFHDRVFVLLPEDFSSNFAQMLCQKVKKDNSI
jgi:hypothetical protein